MSSYQDFKSFHKSNQILFIIILFIIVYTIVNWNTILNKNYFNGEYTKPILITCIIFLISYMFITWDDNTIDTENTVIDIPKYKFSNNLDNNKIQGEIIAANTNFPNKTSLLNQNNLLPNQNQTQTQNQTQSLNSKYKIVNKYDIGPQKNLNNLNNLNNLENNSIGDSKLSNQNIFISHKNSSKYGLKF